VDAPLSHHLSLQIPGTLFLLLLAVEDMKERSRNAKFSSFRHTRTPRAQTLWCPSISWTVLYTFRMEQWLAGLPESVLAVFLLSLSLSLSLCAFISDLMCWTDRCKIRFARSFNRFWNISAPFSHMLPLITLSSYTSISLGRFSIEKKKVPLINRITLQSCSWCQVSSAFATARGLVPWIASDSWDICYMSRPLKVLPPTGK